MMLITAAVAILITMGLALIRIMAGPTTYDRILAMNVFGTKTVLLIAVIAFLAGRPEFIDIAIVYALINFVGIVAILKFFEYLRQRRGEGPIEPTELESTRDSDSTSVDSSR